TSGNGVPVELREQIVRVPGVASVHPFIIHPIALPELREDDKPQSALLVGTEVDESDPMGGSDWGLEKERRRPPAWEDLAIGAYIGEKLDARLPTDADGHFTIIAGGERHRLRAVGVLKASGPAATLGGNVIAMLLPAAAAVRGRPELVTRFDVKLEPD